MVLIRLIPNPVTIPSYNIFDSIRQRPAFSTDKMLWNLAPTLHYQLVCSPMIPVRYFFKCCFGGCQQFSMGERSGEEAQLKKYSKLFSAFHRRTMFRRFALSCPLWPSSSKTKSCLYNNHGFTRGSRIWLMYNTWSDILPFVWPGTS